MKAPVVIVLVVLVVGLVAAACGPSAPPPTPTPAGDAAAGKENFTATCSACHGPDGTGIPNLGKNLTTSKFVAGKTDAELVDFLKVGRPASDPANTVGVDMPPRGGNPALTDVDLLNIVAFIRTIHQ